MNLTPALDVIYGSTSLPQSLLATIVRNLEQAGVEGTLYIGYPVMATAESNTTIDALLVAQKPGLVALHFPQKGEDYKAAQDRLYYVLESNLGRHESLRRRRTLGITVNVVSVFPEGEVPTAAEAEYPTASPSTLVAALGRVTPIDDAQLFRAVSAAIQRVTTIKPVKRRQNVAKDGSKGSILRAIEKEKIYLARSLGLRGIIVAEPTRLAPVRGHRSHINFTAEATGTQAHSSLGTGVNANLALIPFLMEMRALHARLRSDASLQDPNYDPPFSDFNIIIDNHGTALNVTVARATCGIKYRYSHRIDPTPVVEAVRAAAARAGVALSEQREGPPPELPEDHPLIRLAVQHTNQRARTVPYGTDACELQAIAPCVVLGPESSDTIHTPHERARIADLAAAVPLFGRLLAVGRAG